MVELSRRSLLASSSLAAAAMALGACDTAPPKAGSQARRLTWWDHFDPLQDLHKDVFAQFGKDTGVTVGYTLHQTAKMGQALQLAKQSDQLPDIHSNVGLHMEIPALIRDGWYQPLQFDDAVLRRLPQDALADGTTTFGKKIYGLPIFNFRQYWAAVWFNRDLVTKAGLDPEDPPQTYDEFRKAARAVQSAGGDGVYGWVTNLAQPDRVAEQVHFLAQSAGFSGSSGNQVTGGVDFRTGEYAFHAEPYLKVIEFLLSLKKDKLLLPGTASMNVKVARARWAAGAAGFFFDGPWCAGVVAQNLKGFADKLGVGPMLVPERGMPVTAYRAAQEGALWLSGASDQPELASKLLGYLTNKEYYVGLAENMDQPPLDLSAVDRANVHPAYKKVLGLFADAVFLAPSPVRRNPDVAGVGARKKEVKPGIGELVGGMFSGDVLDVRKALKQLSDKHEAAREQAVAEARKDGAKVDVDAWAFSDWKPREDYTADRYEN